MITGGGDRYYGIYLHLVYPRKYRIAVGDEDPEIARIENGAAILRADWSCTVTKEESHQHTLLRYAPSEKDEYREVVASLGLCQIETGKHRGHEAIEVRINGARVGQLTMAMSTRYLPVLTRVFERQLEALCTAFVVHTKKGLEVEPRMPPDPGRKSMYM
jgi:hypothetical protein